MLRFITSFAITLGLVSTYPVNASAEDLAVKTVLIVQERDSDAAPYAIVEISWKNGWNSSRNHDAAWVFAKGVQDGGGFSHIPIGQVSVIPGDTSSPGMVRMAGDQTGFWLIPPSGFNGDVRTRVRVDFDNNSTDTFRGTITFYGVEMVYIPGGAFYAGEPSPKAVSFGSFYTSDNDGNPRDYYRIVDESEINVGSQAGNLSYAQGEYTGDATGSLPRAFPKGSTGFYIMKYEMTQGQYAAMLNTLPDEGTYNRVSFMGRSYYSNRGSIRLQSGSYETTSPDRPMNYATWDDQLAFADWAALRPMTELEFEKASRGPEKPIEGAFPWGTADRLEIARIVTQDGDTVTLGEVDEANRSDETRARYGASYYWVMDLAGSVWERVITIGSEDGRTFAGSHGDGNTSYRGDADNADWPHTYSGKEGHGYRGGGFYGDGVLAHEFNPYSPVSFRRYGGWSGADPHRAYGFRAVRTAE
ncbi:MAG: SUMF1/EgtB/PvdO family nonheme iron enzyme [Rhodothermales bacterium]|nr:SUMF1/EgtB/PvdO family nonheme iron enzyme [Rhodothermales bacterium]